MLSKTAKAVVFACIRCLRYCWKKTARTSVNCMRVSTCACCAHGCCLLAVTRVWFVLRGPVVCVVQVAVLVPAARKYNKRNTSAGRPPRMRGGLPYALPCLATILQWSWVGELPAACCCLVRCTSAAACAVVWRITTLINQTRLYVVCATAAWCSYQDLVLLDRGTLGMR